MSYTLIKHGIDPKTLDTPCATCNNAVWRSISGASNNDFEQYYPLNYHKTDEKIGCWCILFHTFIQSRTTCCDGNVPESEPKIDDFLKK